MNKLNIIKSLFSFALLIFSPLRGMAQEALNQDFLRNIGKIYVVVAVIVIIFIGIILFLVILERRIHKIEKQIIDNE